MLARARSGWSPPPWLDHLLTVTESRVCAVAGDTRAAMDAARRAGTVPIPQPPDCQPPPVIEPLTERERDVLRLAGELLSTDEIADKLFISTNTVKTHLKNSFRKLGVTDRRDAVRRARETGSL